jgi:hypothetical protein
VSLSPIRQVLHAISFPCFPLSLPCFSNQHLVIPFLSGIFFRRICYLVLGSIVFQGCSGPMAHYAAVERSLLAGQPAKAIQIMQAAKEEYGTKDRLLFLMDQGMVLHLAGQYAQSNIVLEEAHFLIEDLYTKRLRDEASALLVNEARQPYEGAPHEHVMVNVVKALNYAALQQWDEALVEARRIDHRLNVLSDKGDGKDTYHEDPFARYLVGLLYEIAGDFNNAYVGYRKAELVYQEGQGWTRVSLPDVLKSDLIRTANRLGLLEEAKRYQEHYPEVAQPGGSQDRQLAQLVVLTYSGHGPKKEDLFIDVPISLDALRLVALTKPGLRGSTRKTRGGEALLYGIHGRIARIALPRFTWNKKFLALDTIQVRGSTVTITTSSQRMYDINAVAEKTLADEYDSLVLRAVARTAMKLAAAEGIAIGARAVAGKNNRDWVGPLVGGIARVFALATEEADIRSWRTLPGEIRLARLWLEPGDYSVTINSRHIEVNPTESASSSGLHLHDGETRLFFQRSGP